MGKEDISSRHSKIIGDLGELVICNWLSRSKFEVMLVDHTGIDILACAPKTQKKSRKRYGITVKSRTRTTKKSERESVDIFKKDTDRTKLVEACAAFDCEPWVAIYVEAVDSRSADIYLTSLENYEEKYAGSSDKATRTWLMSGIQKRKYEKDSRVKHFRISFEHANWGAPWE